MTEEDRMVSELGYGSIVMLRASDEISEHLEWWAAHMLHTGMRCCIPTVSFLQSSFSLSLRLLRFACAPFQFQLASN